MTATATATRPLPWGVEKDRYISRRKEAGFCWFYSFWTGNDIMFSVGYTIRECKVSGRIWAASFGTEINPKGPTEFEQWEQDCWNYIPEGYSCSFEELAAMPNTSWAGLSIDQLKERFEEEKNNLALNRNYFSRRPRLYNHWAFGSPSELKRLNRKQWQERHRLRKAYREVSEQEFFQMALRGRCFA